MSTGAEEVEPYDCGRRETARGGRRPGSRTEARAGEETALRPQGGLRRAVAAWHARATGGRPGGPLAARPVRRQAQTCQCSPRPQDSPSEMPARSPPVSPELNKRVPDLLGGRKRSIKGRSWWGGGRHPARSQDEPRHCQGRASQRRLPTGPPAPRPAGPRVFSARIAWSLPAHPQPPERLSRTTKPHKHREGTRPIPLYPR